MKKKRKMDIKTLSMLCVATGTIMIAISFNFFQEITLLFTSINITAIMIALGVPLAARYEKFNEIKEIENMFPMFLRDITDNIKSGMTLPQAIRATKGTDYGLLTKYVEDMGKKIEWGIPFATVLKNFSDQFKSMSMKRTVRTIIEAHESGGTIDTVMDVVASSVKEVEKIKKKRSERVYGQMMNGYFIYIIFLGVMFGLSNFLLPAFESTSNIEALKPVFSEMFRNLTVIQGIFAGLSIGKMAEGSLISGFKHSFVLVLIGYGLFLFV